MERLAFILAIAQGKHQVVIDAIDKLKFIPREGPRHPELQYTRKDGSILRIYLYRITTNITLPQDSAGANGKWSIYYCLPAGMTDINRKPIQDWKVGTQVFRKLRRVIVDDRNRDRNGNRFLLGPWSLKEVDERFPAFANKYLYPLDKNGVKIPGSSIKAPLVVAGDSPETVASIDYRPTALEAFEDTEIEKEVLFPHLKIEGD